MGTGLHLTAVVVKVHVVIFQIDWGIILNQFIFSTQVPGTYMYLPVGLNLPKFRTRGKFRLLNLVLHVHVHVVVGAQSWIHFRDWEYIDDSYWLLNSIYSVSLMCSKMRAGSSAKMRAGSFFSHFQPVHHSQVQVVYSVSMHNDSVDSCSKF